MSEVMTVFRREFLERVRSRSFAISTVLFPILMAALWIVPARMGGGGGSRHLVIVDQAPAGVGQAVQQLLTAPAPAASGDDDDARDRVTFTAERVTRPLDQVRTELMGRVQRKEIDGYLYLPPDIVQSSQAQYRARNVAKRSGRLARVTLAEDAAGATPREVEVLDLDAALEELAMLDPRKARVAELRFFGGLSLEEVGTVLDTSVATTMRDWQAARAWLYKRLSRRNPGPAPA